MSKDMQDTYDFSETEQSDIYERIEKRIISGEFPRYHFQPGDSDRPTTRFDCLLPAWDVQSPENSHVPLFDGFLHHECSL